MIKANTQKSGAAWVDEANIAIPFNRVSKLELVKEAQSGKLLKEACKVSETLNKLRQMVEEACNKVSNAVHSEALAGGKTPTSSKGNFTWFNFDRTIKIEVNVNETIKFDESRIAAARELFDKFISKNVQGTDDIVRQLINSAFANTKGGLDSKKVLGLLKFRSKIKDDLFHQALDHIEASISRPSSKRYFRIWAMDENGSYQNIELNFSNI
jgi:Protein of unknown function (DUF3164)